MSDDRRKMNKSSTGTVPKIKHRNNTSCLNDGDSPRSWTNNLAPDFHRLNLSDYLRNSRRNCTMNAGTIEEQPHLNATANGSITPNTNSSSVSRRNSSGAAPKCDNITKYPDKKQIEDKLTQIREYLQITTSLMSSMKNTDEQWGDSTERNNLAKMIKDLKDSEDKLVHILSNVDDTENGGEVTVDGNENYAETFTSNSLRNELEDKIDHTNRELELLRDQQYTLLSLQQKAENKMKDARHIQEKLMSQYGNDVNNTLNQRDKNLTSVQDFDQAIRELEERTKRLNEPRGSNPNIQDKLCSEMDSLQTQIVQLHNVNDERNQLIQVLDNRDAELRAQHQELQSKLSELQIKKMQIDQLVAQLQNIDDPDDDDVGIQVRRIVTMKDQLSKLKDMLEVVKQTDNTVQNSNGEQDLACDVCAKSDNVDKRRTTPVQVESNQARYDKQMNKNAIAHDRQGAFGGARPKQPTNPTSRMTLQAELEAKKRELEEIMGKHKAGTSNLNHDVGTDNKSEFSCSSNAYFEGSWAPIMPEHNRFDSSESEEEYPNQPFPLQYSQIKQEKPRADQGDYVHLHEPGLSALPRTPERHIASIPTNREHGKNQVQKQLELIRSVCDSMLDQAQNTNCQQLRNNLTPSTLYSEPRRFNSPNVGNAMVESNWGHNESWVAANTLQTQAFMLNTLNQCCQMLWLQQRELMALRQMVMQMQEASSHLPATNSDSRTSQKGGNQVAAACSMPNLNQYNIPAVNLDPCFQNNMQNARLLDPCLNNTSEHINNSVLHANINQMNGQMWNGQALNNQVAPGNRANNYWDNFRSYSRQNLLSTKSNEGFQNISTLERSNNPFTLLPTSKSNSEQTSTENTPSRRVQCVRNSDNRNNAGVPPDVLNVNHNVNKPEVGVGPRNLNENDSNLCYHFLNNAFAYNEISSNHSNISEEQIFKDCVSETVSRRNEWHEEQVEERHSKSKLFEELRENVYKEVVTLISANEARPHFLIQLFRDLQMISSDPLRLKILQSIQTIITHSLVSTNHINRQVLEPQQNESIIPGDNFSLQSTVWSKSLKNPTVTSRNTLHLENDTLELQNVIKEIIPYLNSHEDDVIGHPFLAILKQTLIESESFRATLRDAVFKKHFSNVLDEVLSQYHGKKVRDVKMDILQTINDLLRGELSFIQLIQDTCPETGDGDDVAAVFEASIGAVLNGPADQNGDLAEADQGRVKDDEIEEEGAVGGFWDLQIEAPTMSTEEDLTVEFINNSESQTQFIKQGLDQVPTRLPTKSRSNTPNKDRAGSSRSNHSTDQF